MRKLIATAAVVLLSAGAALAASGTIRNSAHDLSSTSTYTRLAGERHYDGEFDQMCAYCHTPHKGDLTVTNAPLWNRSNPDATAYNYYNSATLTAAAKPTTVKAGINTSDVPLCMSCHDGTSLTDPLKNPVSGNDNDFTDGANPLLNIGATSNALLLDGGNSLTNDHPVGFNYDTAQGADTGLNARGVAEGKGAKFFGTGTANLMWCSSCHAVHNPGTASDKPFLRTSNASSALCLACHNK